MRTTKTSEIATSLVWMDGYPSAILTNKDGDCRSVELKELNQRGIPNNLSFKKIVTHRLTTDLRSWVAFEPDEYLKAYGFKDERITPVRHDFFSFTQKGKTFVVPALTLIRAFMLPQGHAFVESFQQNFLERVIQVTADGNGAFNVKVTGGGAWKVVGKLSPYIECLYSWFASHPTGTRLANSIHKHAHRGRISIDLPDVLAEIKCTGQKVAGVILVNRVRLCRLEPLEQALFRVEGHSETIEITNMRRDRRTVQGRASLQYSIPCNADGTIEVSKFEWSAMFDIAEIDPPHRNMLKHDQRAIFNSILHKLHSGKTWQECDFGALKWSHASSRFHQWHKTGRFPALIGALQTLRQTQNQVQNTSSDGEKFEHNSLF